MFIDNQIGLSMGLPTGGFSNTWETDEEILGIDFPYTIGHTIRPNGEILEGNPALPDMRIPMTRTNFQTYFEELVSTALNYLEDHPASKEWAMAQFGDDVLIDDVFWTEDLDLDLVPNMLEFTSGTNPHVPSGNVFAVSGTEDLEWSVENIPEIIVLEGSQNLADWSSIETWIRPVPGVYRVSLSEMSLEEDPHQFYRLRIEL